MKNKPHKLFISHSSKDAEYMKAFVDLLVAIGVHKNQITCTSVPQCYIPVRCNILAQNHNIMQAVHMG